LRQDVIFGSEGTAQADFERMEEINNEIGLTAMLRGGSGAGGSDNAVNYHEKEKLGEHREKSL
jgi:archaellum component FlaC